MRENCPELIAKSHSAVFEEAESQEVWEARMQRRMNETIAGLKKNMWVLGTIGSSAPFVGLFGTVWGIMGSFSAIGAAGKAGFAVVAASISEALIATAIGLFAAIPAVLAFNHYTAKGETVYSDRALFAEEMVALLQRQTVSAAQENN